MAHDSWNAQQLKQGEVVKTVYAIERTITPGEWMVTEWSEDDPGVANIVFVGTQSECERYQRETERDDD